MYLWSQCNSCQNFNEFFFIEIENICMDPRKIPQIAKGTRTDLKALHFKLGYKTVIIKKNIVLA